MEQFVVQLLPFAVAAVFATLLWRHWRQRRGQRAIDAFPYEAFLDRRLAARRPELDAAQRRRVLAGLKQYFHLCHAAGRRMVSMPSQAVDDAWHEFILFTRRYDSFCRQAFGRFLHHTPAEAMASPTQATDGIRRAWRLACAREGIDPKKPQRLPELFAIDAALSIAGGFVYRLDCMAAGRAGDGYCASHIGCGSGCSGDSGSADGDGGGDGGGCGGGGD